MSPVAVGGLLGLVASVGLIASVSRVPSPSTPVAGGAAGGLSALHGVGGAAPGLLSPTTTESIVRRVVHGGMPGLGGRFGAPPGPRTTPRPRRGLRTSRSTRSTGRLHTRSTGRSTPSGELTSTVTPLASVRTRVTSTELPTAWTTIQLRIQSTDKRDRPTKMHMEVETSVTYGEPTTRNSKTSAISGIIREQSLKNLTGAGFVTIQPSHVLPIYTEEGKIKSTHGQLTETTAVPVVTTDSQRESSAEIYRTMAANTRPNQTKLRTIGLSPHAASRHDGVTETLETQDTTDNKVTHPVNREEHLTSTERTYELTTEGITGSERTVKYTKQSHGTTYQIGTTKKPHVSDTVRTAEDGMLMSTISTTSVRESIRQVGLATTEDIPDVTTATSGSEIIETSGSSTHSATMPGDLTIGPRDSVSHTIQDTTDADMGVIPVLDEYESIDDRVTGHTTSKTTSSIKKSDATVALDPTNATRRDKPPTTTYNYKRTPSQIIGYTTTDQLVKGTAHYSTQAPDAVANVTEATAVVVMATTADAMATAIGKIMTGVNILRSSTVQRRDNSTGNVTPDARRDTKTSTTLPTPVSNQSMSPRLGKQEIDRPHARRHITFPPTVPTDVAAIKKKDERSTDRSMVNHINTTSNDTTNRRSARREWSHTSTQAVFSNDGGDDTTDGRVSSADPNTTHEYVHHSTESYTQSEQTSSGPHKRNVGKLTTALHQSSSVTSNINSSTDAFETTSDPNENTNNAIVNSGHTPGKPVTTTSVEVASSDTASTVTANPGTTSKTSPVDRNLLTTSVKNHDVYTSHHTQTKHTEPFVTQVSPTHEVKISNPNDESKSTTTIDVWATEETKSVTLTNAGDFSQNTTRDNATATKATSDVSQGKHYIQPRQIPWAYTFAII